MGIVTGACDGAADGASVGGAGEDVAAARVGSEGGAGVGGGDGCAVTATTATDAVGVDVIGAASGDGSGVGAGDAVGSVAAEAVTAGAAGSCVTGVADVHAQSAITISNDERRAIPSVPRSYAYAGRVTTAVIDDRARIPRPVAFVIVGAILAATLLALFWPSLPFNDGRRVVLGPTKVGVIARQVENERAAGRTGAPAPDFEWIAPDGKRVSLGSLRPKSVVVNFWATWCEPCRKEMPLLDRAAADNAGVVFLAVDLDEDGDKIRSFFDEIGVKHLEPLLDVGLATSRRYGLASVPSTFFIDNGGTIRHVRIGEMDGAKLRSGLDSVR